MPQICSFVLQRFCGLLTVRWRAVPVAERTIDLSPAVLAAIERRGGAVVLIFPRQACYSDAVGDAPRVVPLFRCELRIEDAEIEAMPDVFRLRRRSGSFHSAMAQERLCFPPHSRPMVRCAYASVKPRRRGRSSLGAASDSTRKSRSVARNNGPPPNTSCMDSSVK